ncbi:ATP dependent DNA ligase [Arthrobacter crystallopoietes BAB-32]|uniref:ATP dependent DNA ligase n=1 Tax=Arthrobacter crystallopoietes BAB-32 TaxID=1246476 RepID=N1V4Q5_9MICC|nr:ATP-dependent DNA ligase [Arthrobacter crystallopoietes]EMY35004.1 ATP dependent DNA ligase [Arthrobacter crystallopoietes BAB-32]
MSSGLPHGLRPPVKVALARAVEKIPRLNALPGGSVYEPKWDGYRAVLSREGEEASIWSRQGKDLSRYFPDLVAAAAEQVPSGCVLDGETVVWSGERLDFSALQQRLSTATKALTQLARQVPAHFVAFDLLAVAGHDIRDQPLHVRRQLLEELAKDWTEVLELSPVTADPETAARWFEELPATGIEGLVVKGRAQPYEGGQRQWLKVKHRETIEVVCAAVIGPIDRPEAVVAGLPIEGELRIVGRSAMLKPSAGKQLGAQLRPSAGEHPWPKRIKSTTLDRFNPGQDETVLTLIEPIVVEVSADTAWSGQSFRHTLRFLRSRPELNVADVRPPSGAGQ